METLREAYQAAKSNDGAPGSDGVTFEAIEEGGAERFLKQIRDELVVSVIKTVTYRADILEKVKRARNNFRELGDRSGISIRSLI